MKYAKITAILLSLTLLCSCTDSESITAADTAEPESSAAETNEQTSCETETAPAEPEETAEPAVGSELPRMDGSTSATPLEIGLKSGFLGIPYNEAKELVSHTTTHDSFKRLINGEVDLIFSVPISEEQRQLADEAGVTLFMEPVAREGFVFAVNADNPVSSLTSEQLREIYSGEITNWAEVGGNDEQILPYQRNTDSGSQNYMTEFMGDTPLLPPRVELTQGMMMSLMDAIAVYDNSAGAIGYSVYSYAAQMYANANKVKFISVDGVAPSKATMADESYPLLSCTYIIYTDKSPESAREFAEMALSDEGQGYVLDSGYLPVNGMEVPEKYLPYEAVGTGAPRPADYTPSRQYSKLNFSSDRHGYIKSYDGYFEITFLEDKDLQARINSDIRAAMDELKNHYKPEYALESLDTIDGINIGISCRNGYLSVILGYRDYDAGETYFMEPIYAYYYAETLSYDLTEGAKIERFSDLFYEGEDFLPELNQSIADWISRTLKSSGYTLSNVVEKQDFSCILGEPRLFTIDMVGLEPDNLYFTCAPFLAYDGRSGMVSQYRDMSGIVNKIYSDSVYNIEYEEWETDYTIENGDVYKRFTGSRYHTDEEVRAEDELWYELQRRAWDTIRLSDPEWHSGGDGYYTDIAAYRWKNFYSIGLRGVGFGEYPFANFDRDTLELITIEMLLGDDWRQYLGENADSGLNYIPSEWFNNAETITILAYPDTPSGEKKWGAGCVYFNVPLEAVNEKYRDRYEQ